ncbi:hypothetical protein SAMN02745664_104109 [Moraxella cuniculi DSM 21768]|uniref:Uncharacterized protein n=1 Tax=Moraxella cuniculi DSM 21768 TaxID=1122245 RepID=A0A1N7EEC6_9GAMM|nr:hypothetical protein [Moraxella cuniculi]OOS05298.1 hypothetical protein B0189_06695 [Moraxella cuniculi]SIR86420.1 hypothetical protein SAMN02745664_104109 [Moraxella cuniculi DSM 21768]
MKFTNRCKLALSALVLATSHAYAEQSYLESAYGISAEEVQLRLDLQEQVIALSEKLNTIFRLHNIMQSWRFL